MTCFTPPRIYPVVNVDSLEEPLLFIGALLESGITFLQLRAKKTPDRSFLEISRETVRHRNGLKKETKILINDRVDICKLSGADGIHLGQNDIPTKQARNMLGEKAIIGFSTHTLDELKRTHSMTELDYVALGPIFNTSSKESPEPAIGLQTLKKAAAISTLPLIAIGGITRENAKEVFEAGASSIAFVSALQEKAWTKKSVQDGINYFLKAFQQSSLSAPLPAHPREALQ